MKILTLDIETSPNKGWAFNVWQNNMLANQIIEPTKMLTWAAKFLGKKVEYRTFEDPDFHTKLYDMWNHADAIVTYNGDKFDLRHIKREFVTHKFPPPRPPASIDLIKTVKQNFCFPHNSLAYVGSKLLGETKLETGGFDLWPSFMDGDPKARRVMERYNKKDTTLTEKLYLYLRPWIKNHPYLNELPAHLGDEDYEYECPACGSWDTEHKRPRRTRCFAIRLVSCNKCGHWADGTRKKM